MKNGTVVVSGFPDSERVDRVLHALFAEHSREYLKELCRQGLVTVDGRTVRPSARIRDGAVIAVSFPERSDVTVGDSPDLPVIFEDDDVLVVNKPAGMLVHPARRLDSRLSVIEIVGRRYPGVVAGAWPLERPFLVHRLDAETSGVLIVAKNPRAQAALAAQFERRIVKKTYRAVACGRFRSRAGEISAPLVRSGTLVRVGEGGRDALTRFTVLQQGEHAALVELHPLTGRTHQLRAHLSFIGHPIVGDQRYGWKGTAGMCARRVMLHAYRIEFQMPGDRHTGGERWQTCTAEPPPDFVACASGLR